MDLHTGLKQACQQRGARLIPRSSQDGSNRNCDTAPMVIRVRARDPASRLRGRCQGCKDVTSCDPTGIPVHMACLDAASRAAFDGEHLVTAASHNKASVMGHTLSSVSMTGGPFPCNDCAVDLRGNAKDHLGDFRTVCKSRHAQRLKTLRSRLRNS